MTGFFNELKVQRWDDHRYYHHSKVNQSLHFVSATSFLVAYVVAFSDPAMAALIGWLVAMTSRQVGHSDDERAANVAGAFEASPSVKGLKLLLIDDVLTTGATASEAADALLRAGAVEVQVLTLARAVRAL